MKIIKYKGGLGNQMFQYAFGRALQEKYLQKHIVADFRFYQDKINGDTKRPNILELNILLKVADKKKLDDFFLFVTNPLLSKMKGKVLIGLEAIFNKEYYLEYNRAWRNPEKLLKYTYYDGYWQSWKYLIGIERKLRDEFQFKGNIGVKSRHAIIEYSKVNSVMLGIRRGDYLQESQHYGILTQEYYQKCMSYISNRIPDPIFIVFSNDIEWVKNHMDLKNYNVIYRTRELQDSDTEELMVMAACKHFIIANSTYQWWGAWLGKSPEKVVIAPNKWFADNKPIDIVPPDWLRI